MSATEIWVESLRRAWRKEDPPERFATTRKALLVVRPDNRMFVEAVLWVVRTGSPWRDLPDVFGAWTSVFRRRSHKSIWGHIFEAMSDDPDFEYLIVDATIIRAHEHAAGAKRELQIRPLGLSRDGLSPKIHMAVRGLGRPVRFVLNAGHRGDAPQAEALIDGLSADFVIADAAYSNRLRDAIADEGATVVISSNLSRSRQHPLDKHLHAQRYLTEC